MLPLIERAAGGGVCQVCEGAGRVVHRDCDKERHTAGGGRDIQEVRACDEVGNATYEGVQWHAGCQVV